MVINTRYSNITLSAFFIYLFSPVYLLAMNQQQQNDYDQLIPDIDIAYNQENNGRLAALMGYNQAILEVLHSIRDSALPSLQWAHNRIAVIEFDAEKSDAQFNAIETIVGKFTRLYGEAKTRVQVD